MSKITSNSFRRSASDALDPHVYKITIRISVLEHDSAAPPPSFDLRVIPVSLSSLSQHCTWSCLPQVRRRVDAALLYTSYQAEETSPETAFSPGFQSSQCLIPPNKQLSSPGLSSRCCPELCIAKHQLQIFRQR